MVKKYKFTIASIVPPDYMIVQYSGKRLNTRKILASTRSKTQAKKKLIAFANKKQSTNIYIEAQVAGSDLK